MKKLLSYVLIFTIFLSVFSFSESKAEDTYAWVLVDTHIYEVSEYFRAGDFWTHYGNSGPNMVEFRTTAIGGLGPYSSTDYDNPPDMHAKYTWTNPPNIIKPEEKITIRLTQEVISAKTGNYGIGFSPTFKIDSADLNIGSGTSSLRRFTGVYPDGTKASDLKFYPGYISGGRLVGGGDPQFQTSTWVDLSVNFYQAMSEGTRRSLYATMYAGSPGSLGTRYTYEYKKVDPKLLVDNNRAEAFESGARISWNQSPGIGYRLYRSENPNELGISVTDFLITSTSYADVNVKPNTTYYYTVKPVLAEANPFQGIEEKLGNIISTFTVRTGGEIYKPGIFKNFIILQIENPYLTLNGLSLEIDPGRGTEPIIVNGRTMVPIRAVVEAMDGQVGWEDASQKITLNARGNTVTMWLNKTDIIVNGQATNMDVAPVVRNGRTFVPIRFAAENLNTKVDWINSTREAVIVFEE